MNDIWFTSLRLTYAYLVSLVMGGILVRWVVKKHWKTSRKDQNIDKTFKDTYIGFSDGAGTIERVLYTTSIIQGYPQFIGVWLVFKVASHWFTTQTDKTRVSYNIFYIGAGLSLMFGVLGGMVSDWMLKGNYYYVIGFPFILVGFSIVLWIMADRTGKKI